MKSCESEAEEIIKSCGIQIPTNFETICEKLSSASLKIEYYEKKIETKNIDGMSFINNNIACIIVNSEMKYRARRLFTAAHELGHIILHIQTGKKTKPKCSTNDIFENSPMNIELEANQFASALLMPRHLIKKKIYREKFSWRLINNISQYFNTSLTATARRVIDISTEMCALIIHDRNSIWPPIRSKNFPCYFPISSFPIYLQFTEHDKNNFPAQLEECDLSDWNLDLYKNQYRCYYSSLNFKRYSRTMTLLTLEEIENEEDQVLETFIF